MAAKKHAQGMKARLTLVDGIRVDTDESWAIVRASGTENVMRIFAEAKTRKKSESLMEDLRNSVQQAV